MHLHPNLIIDRHFSYANLLHFTFFTLIYFTLLSKFMSFVNLIKFISSMGNLYRTERKFFPRKLKDNENKIVTIINYNDY